ncbi:putative UDP-galactose translocator [Tribonema minus]|uniref:Putative UDP-galactose translocator n=1 Tax=Tribonema minus TaxID=303371 RepID=A0A835YMG2_9STRA|nr:putative UDP-galactose translocator [Tribonema minus]
MLLLALQFGLQPLVQKSCINREEVNRVSLVMATELTKVAICLSVMVSSGFLADIQSSWTLKSSMKAAALPAALYALQNWLIQIAYMNLDSLTYNLLNQTKTLSAALCLYVVMGRRQSGPQIVALAMLVAAALLLNSRTASDKDGASGISWELGVVPVMGASLLSGFSAAVTQKSLQERGRNSYLLSAELGLYGIVTLLVTTLAAEGGVQVRRGGMLRDGLWRGWTPWTCLPVFTQAAGGVVVGQVTKHAGSVKKGFALVGGILVTAAAQYVLEREPLSPEHYVSAVLVALSTVLHARYPYVPKAKVQ